MSTDDLDWNNDEDVVVPEQTAIAVYLDSKGDMVIRRAFHTTLMVDRP